MQIYDRELPPELEKLYEDAVAYRPDAQLKFVLGMPEGSRLDGRHTADRDGNSEVRVATDWDFPVLAHELMHVVAYRRGLPYASVLPFETNFSTVAQVITCAATHAHFHADAIARGLPPSLWHDKVVSYPKLDAPDEPALSEQSFIEAWRLADAIFCDRDAVAHLEAKARAELPQTWAVTERILQTMERCRGVSGVGWRKAMVDLLGYFDAMAKEHHPAVLPPSKTIALTLVLSEAQLKRPADRLIEIAVIDKIVVGFMNKQDRSIFHFLYLGPKTQKQELATLRAQLKQKKVEDFLDLHWVQYTVDLRAGKPVPSA